MSTDVSLTTIDMKDIYGTGLRTSGIISFEKSPERRFYYEKDLEKRVKLEETREERQKEILAQKNDPYLRMKARLETIN